MTGEQLYVAHREAFLAERSAVVMAGILPTWKRLKPKSKRIWNRTAAILDGQPSRRVTGR